MVTESDSAQNSVVGLVNQEFSQLGSVITKLINHSAAMQTQQTRLEAMLSEVLQRQSLISHTGGTLTQSLPENLTTVTPGNSQPTNPAPPPQRDGMI